MRVQDSSLTLRQLEPSAPMLPLELRERRRLRRCLTAAEFRVMVAQLCGINSAVECQLPKLKVDGSNPLSRSIVTATVRTGQRTIVGIKRSAGLRRPDHGCSRLAVPTRC